MDGFTTGDKHRARCRRFQLPAIVLSVTKAPDRSPLLDGAVHVIESSWLPLTAAAAVGAPGVVAGERESELDAAPAPATFTARTDTVYVVPFTRRVVPPDWLITVYGEVPLRVLHDVPPLVEYWNDVIAEPPSHVGAVRLIVNCRSPRTTESSVGASGTVRAVTLAETADFTPSPFTFSADTRNQ